MVLDTKEVGVKATEVASSVVITSDLNMLCDMARISVRVDFSESEANLRRLAARKLAPVSFR